MHDVETIFHLSYVLTASGNLFLNMNDVRETANCSFTDILECKRQGKKFDFGVF